MKLCVLGSGSGGNCAVVIGPGGSFLIDAGLSARQILSRLVEIGIAADSLLGVLLTHEHGDHTRGLDVLLRGPLAQVPVYCNPHTCAVVRPALREDKCWRLIETGSAFFLAGLRVETFSVPHDAVDPIGFVLENPSSGSRFGILSDIGHATTNVLARLRDLDGLFLEANYCPTRLANDAKRPWATKQRISSRHGHLSNDQAADLVSAIASPRLRRLLLGHLSRECNCPATATSVLASALTRLGFANIDIVCATQDQPTALFAIAPELAFAAMASSRTDVSPAVAWQQPELFM
ncbi:MAG: MBL fold metallo-hydrolase [Verrucomicrobiales bacterium]